MVFKAPKMISVESQQFRNANNSAKKLLFLHVFALTLQALATSSGRQLFPAILSSNSDSSDAFDQTKRDHTKCGRALKW